MGHHLSLDLFWLEEKMVVESDGLLDESSLLRGPVAAGSGSCAARHAAYGRFG